MERQGASHKITQTRPGSGNSVDPVKKTRMLKSAVTRTRNRADALAIEYGAHDVPRESPYYPKIAKARQAHEEALDAWIMHTKGI